MPTFTPPYYDAGVASFEVMDTYLQNFLLAGSHPELKPAVGFPMPNSTTFAQFSVVGISNGRLALATEGVDPVAATGALTFSGTGTAADTISVGGVVYTLRATASVAGEVTIGGSAAASAANFAAAINGNTLNAVNPNVSATVVGAVVTLTARQTGLIGNQIATVESGSGTSFAAATLTGGLDQGGVKAIGVMPHEATLGASGSMNAQVWYSGCFNMDALVWHPSFDTDAKKAAAFLGSPTPTTILVAKRGA